jgi:hypothetical protein
VAVKELISMTNILRWVVVAVLVGHGLIHLLGVVKGFGWAEVAQLKQSIGAVGGVLWLLAALLVLASAALIAVGAPTWWWVIAVCGAMISQVAIVTSWSDAKAGTLVNVLLALVAAYGFLSVGPTSFHAQWQDRATQALTDADPAPPVLSESDLDELPPPLAAYIRRSGAVGQPRVTSLYADFHGRIRNGPNAAWMPFTGKQVNTFGTHAQRMFLMDATKSGLPVIVFHAYADATATMRAKVLSLITVVDASGPEMDRGETVTVFNDLVVLAPGAITDAPVRWTAMDARHVRGVFTNGAQTVTAELTFDDAGDLVDFVSDDRLRASADGKSFTQQRWSTPLSGHRDAHGHRVLTSGEGRWHAPGPEGWFTYVELHFDDIIYNVHSADGTTDPVPVPQP